MIVGIIGATGFLGINLMGSLRKSGISAVPGGRSLDGDLHVDATNYDSIKWWISRNGITHLVNLAAICGGIGLNKRHPYRLWSATTRITANVLDACLAENVEKVVMIGSVCSYAAECPVPFSEHDLMNHGMPEETNRAYGISKLNGLIGAQSACQEFGMDVVNLVPVNMYGPHDHFDLEDSHVIPALINKIDAAMKTGEDVVTVWGDGSPSREFLFVEDCAEAIMKALAIGGIGPEIINIGTGVEITISELVSTISNIMGWDGTIRWDTDKPNGQSRRCLDISKANDLLGWNPSTNLTDGLNTTVAWYRGVAWN